MTKEPESNRKKFSNWLQGVHALNLSKTALHDHALETWKTEVFSWKKDFKNMKDDILTFFTCVSNNRIKVINVNDNNSPKQRSSKRKWECVCDHPDVCNKILDKVLALQQNPGFNIIWTSNLCEAVSKETIKGAENVEEDDPSENIPRSSTEGMKSKSIWNFFLDWIKTGTSSKQSTLEYQDIFDGCNQAHIWCLANMFMQHGKAKTDIPNSGPVDTDASMFFTMMKNCKLFEIENENYLYDEVSYTLLLFRAYQSGLSAVFTSARKSHLTPPPLV